MKIRAPAPRYRIDEAPGSFAIAMPYDFRLLPRALWVLLAWIPFSALFVSLGIGLTTGSLAPVLGGAAISVAVVGVLAGVQASFLRLVEIVEIVPHERSFERRVEYWGFRSSGTRLDLDYVRGLRVETAPETGLATAYAEIARHRSGPIAFSFGEETYRIGLWVSEAEARMVVGEILARLPELGESAV